MFRLVALFEGKSRICEFRQAFEQAGISHCHFEIFDTYEIDREEEVYEVCRTRMETADLVLFLFHGSMANFKKYVPLRRIFEGNKPYFFYSTIDSEMEEMTRRCQIPAKQMRSLLTYLEAGGVENAKNFIKYLLAETAGMELEYDTVKIPVQSGIYKQENNGKEEICLEELGKSEKPVIGILFHFYMIQRGDTEYIDQLIEVVKKYDCIPLPVYSAIAPSADGSYEGLRADLKNYMTFEGKAVVRSVIVVTGHSLTLLSAPGCGMESISDSVFEILGVPVLHGLITGFSYEQWRESVCGVDPVYLGNVYTGEYDGQLITVVFACTEQIMTPYGEKEKMILIPERAEKLVRLARNWAKLSMLSNQEKKVAIILHNMPPRADRIGCAFGLDTPESVYKIFLRLKAEGFTTKYDFASGKEIIEKILKGLTNDQRFLSEEQIMERAEAIVEPEVWKPWFSHVSEEVRELLMRDWGMPPGDFMTVQDSILVPGIVNGNIFIGLQPPRAYEEKAEECYHSSDIVCPYQYLAFYRYLEQVFGANAVIHVGTHGTLEWLPGKEIGLSENCFPDVAIGDLPNIYPYIINVPGEGAQAKRRSGACVIDHLIPSMTEGGVYGELQVIDDLIASYYKAVLNDPSKLPVIRREIEELAEKLHLDQDLSLKEKDFGTDFDRTIEKLHLWVSEIKDTEIKDGLHIFGQPPAGERMSNMLRLLVRVKNRSVPSLRQSICSMQGYDADALMEHPEQALEGITNAMRLETVDEIGREIFENWSRKKYALSEIDHVIEDAAKKHGLNRTCEEKLRKCLTFVSEQVYPSLLLTTDEMDLFMDGLNGDFVKKGPSGSPSRGNAHILPTGRNFYTVDPNEIPSRASWKTGQKLADQLIEAYRQENGEIPENIAIVVYAGENMKTNGDDISEILYLYGIRPVWLGASDRVIGLEVIPVEELGRPRIDATLRITGLFRDTFPNLIELVDEAVNLAASQEEADEHNFIRKHIREDISEFMQQGMNWEQAQEQAAIRIFGCPPGTYGAGVDIMVNSRKWETPDDLGDAYLTWSGHAYSRKRHGENMRELFAHRLSGCDATVQNISSCETDILDDDDFYNYHGGLISAVKKSGRGRRPSSYSTNTADTSHIKTSDVHTDIARVMRAKVNNPRWIQGMKQHGFRGAQEFSAMIDYMFGWDATSDVIDDYMYDSVFETYFNDRELREWIEQENPYALHAMSERLLEAIQRNMWNASEDKRELLTQIYLEMEGTLEEN